MDPNSNFKLGTSEVSYDYWTIKNMEEMRAWVMRKIPHLIYNEQFLDIIAELEMERLIELRLNRNKIAEQTRAKLEQAKDNLYGA
jgi:hypothetical protein